ncbi:hypothetical protein [Piscinibacter sakaiensis]|uniref:hypothetical protein n=1 Tax=Piscinibacter sakaiensis TaxID=1547922 RepID=UPI003AADDF13
MARQTLDFNLTLARSGDDLRDVCLLRSESYGHHMPGLLDALRKPDAIDLDPETAIFLCRDKATGAAIGTARIQTTRAGSLLIEQCAPVPPKLQTQDRAEIARFSAKRGADPLVKLALWKASYLYCQAAQARWMVIGARSEALVRQYQRLGFDDIYEDRRMIPLTYAGGVPHRILAFDVVTAERTWLASGNALYAFIFETTHPDINLFRPAEFATQRAARLAPAETTPEPALA